MTSINSMLEFNDPEGSKDTLKTKLKLAEQELAKLDQESSKLRARIQDLKARIASYTSLKSPGPKAAQRIERMDRLREMNMFKGRKGGPP